MKIILEVLAEEGGTRLDSFLATRSALLSKRAAKELCERKLVRVNGKAARSGTLLQPGDEIELDEVHTEVRARPERVDRSSMPPIIFENERYLVVEKPSGMDSVVQRGDDPLTLADYIAAYAPGCADASPDPREAGLLQRLDYHTSGLLLAAKDLESWNTLHQLLKSEHIEKQYLALCEGRGPERGIRIAYPLVAAADGKTMRVERDAKESLSNVKLLSAETKLVTESTTERQGRSYSLLRASGTAMRRHQVRAHLAAAGYPLVGDSAYGSTSTLHTFELNREGFLLHAVSIRFTDPWTNKPVLFKGSDPLSGFF